MNESPISPTCWTNRIALPDGTRAQGVIEGEDGTITPFRPFRKGSLLVMSDIHRGASISALPEYEASLTRQMSAFEHVLMNGDNFEMFFIDRAFYGMPPHWQKLIGNQDASAHAVVKKAIDKSIDFLKDFLEKNPQTHLHFVLGNHELIHKFRNTLDAIQERYPNFEWSSEAIKIGDGIFVHGDLPMSSPFEQLISGVIHGEIGLKKACGLVRDGLKHVIVSSTDTARQSYGITDDERDTHRLREAKNEMGWLGVLTVMMERPGQAVINWLRQPEKCVPMLYHWLKRYDGALDEAGKPEMHMCENRTHAPFSMSGIQHVFFGHTHVKFHNLAPKEYGGLVFHNTGALTKTVMREGPLYRLMGKSVSGHGMLEADIVDGKICDVRAFALENNLGQVARR